MKPQALTILSFLLAANAVWADPPEPGEKSRKFATQDKAAQLVQGYYQKATIGPSDADLDRFYTPLKRERHNKLVRRLATITGQNEDIEQRRVLDIERLNAQCETLSLQGGHTSGSATRMAKLIYSVSNQCVDYPPRIQRTIVLSYSSDFGQWQIHRVRNSVAQE